MYLPPGDQTIGEEPDLEDPLSVPPSRHFDVEVRFDRPGFGAALDVNLSSRARRDHNPCLPRYRPPPPRRVQ